MGEIGKTTWCMYLHLNPIDQTWAGQGQPKGQVWLYNARSVVGSTVTAVYFIGHHSVPVIGKFPFPSVFL